MYLDYLEMVRIHNSKEKEKKAAFQDKPAVIAEKIMQKALLELINNRRLLVKRELIQSFKCENENIKPLKDFIFALTGEASPLDLSVLAHWIWMVKKKMIGEDPSYHVMPVLFGKQGGGKTVALNKLIKPIKNFRLNISIDQMADERYFKAMSENFVIVFDEMQGADRADIDALKKQITIDENDFRIFHTQDVTKVKQACSFIGATNRPVAEQIIDSSGMRRFWQLNCQDKLNWDLLEEIDFTALWRGIDERLEDGYILDHAEEISYTQKDMVTKDEITLFVEYFGINSGGDIEEVESGRLYRIYQEWAISNGFKPLNKIWFGRKLSGKGISSLPKKFRNVQTTYYLISATAVNNFSEVGVSYG